MDYGHTSQVNQKQAGSNAQSNHAQPIFSEQEGSFFTAGTGNLPEEMNANPENSLNSENDFTSPLEPTPLSSAELVQPPVIQELPELPKPTAPTELAYETPRDTTELGEVVDLMPPTARNINSPEMHDPTSAMEGSMSINKAEIKTSETLSKAGVKEVGKAISLFKANDDPAEFYELLRGEDGLSASNLKNSYNRKWAA